MQRRRRPADPSPRPGFTILELMVTIGIIIVLIGLLFPAISHIRKQARETDVRQQLEVIGAAIERYHQDFHAYPGPLPEGQVGRAYTSNAAFSGTDPFIGPLTLSTNSVQGTSLMSGGSPISISGSENLVLGLLGGLVYTPSANTYKFDEQAVGQGPKSLSPGNPKQYPPYLEVKPGELTTAGKVFTDEAGATAQDSIIPEILDRFPSNPMPILYLRARVGASGIMSQGDSNMTQNPYTLPSTGAQTPNPRYQYDQKDIAAYTNATPPIGTPNKGIYTNQGLKTSLTSAPGSTTPSTGVTFDTGVLSKDPDSGTIALNGYLNYFKNSQFTPTDLTDDRSKNATGTPRQKDTFILISAGSDRLYGTTDDITNFGGVSE